MKVIIYISILMCLIFQYGCNHEKKVTVKNKEKQIFSKEEKMNIVPDNIKLELGKALIHADKQKVIEIIEKNNLDANSFIDKENSITILLEAVNTLNEFNGSKDQVEIVNYLLDKGANPNIKTSDNYNCLHLALEFHDLSEIALLLITKGNADVNEVEGHGNNPIFIAIREYGNTWREEQKKVNQLRFKIIEELLKRGADLDRLNNHNISARRWIEISNDEKLKELISKYEK